MSAPTEQELKDLAEKLGACMKDKGVKLASAESCTGGWLAKIITDIPGSSEWFTGSVVCYSNESKMSLLGVKENTLTDFGAVSGDTVIEMVDGLFEHTNADVAIAGPDGGTDEKPVGLVWLSWGRRDKSVYAKPYNFEGDREDVRKQSIAQILKNLLDLQIC
jgi:nicotinamide-nucleotide amidase